jgi:hypothetical protein
MRRNVLFAVAVALLAGLGLMAFTWDQQATDDQMNNALSHRVAPGYVMPPP